MQIFCGVDTDLSSRKNLGKQLFADYRNAFRLPNEEYIFLSVALIQSLVKGPAALQLALALAFEEKFDGLAVAIPWISRFQVF